MTTLNGNVSDSATVIVVTPGSEQENGFRFRIDDEILTFLGYDRDSTADIVGYLGGARTRWRVRRGEEGTTAAAHLSGATLYAVAEAFATSEDLTAPSPFAAGGSTPTLADVLAEGNDPGADDRTLFDRDIGDEQASEAINLQAGAASITQRATDGTHTVIFGPNVGTAGDGWSGLTLNIDGSDGNVGDVLTAGPDTGVATWGPVPGSGEIVITEDVSGAAGTYSGSITVPGGAWITGIYWSKIRDFNQAATLIIGDADDPDGFVTGGEVNSYSDGKTANVFASAYPFDVSDAGDYVTVTASMTKALFSATDHDILIVVTVADPTDPPPVDLGELRVLVTWSLPPSSAATFEAAA